LSSIAPAIIEHADGSFYASTGGSGGSRIFGSIFQVILNLDWGFDVSQAIEYGRLHDQLYPMEVEADDIYPSEILASLKGFGHNITGAYSNIQVSVFPS
jgi:gamma-glutamyltranspeptidase/glutathione hydrolase/leukotriene-C4 hydrolase